jgi:hypothetical protein
MPKKNTTRPFVQLDSQQLREVLPHFSGGALKVWVGYKLRSNAQGEAWMTLKTLAVDTGLEPTSCSRHRNFLIRCGGLIPVKDAYRSSSGTFGPPRFRVLIPEKSRMEELPRGNSAVLSNSQLPCGKIARSRAAKLQHQEDKDFQEDVHEEDGANAPGDFENPKKPEDRFDRLKDDYIAEFEKRHPNLKAPFDGSDGKVLKNLLSRQPHVAGDVLVGWLKNAFESDDVPPLRPMFRLREFCAHAEKYALGPLKRGGVPSRAAAIDERQAAQIEGLVVRDGF